MKIVFSTRNASKLSQFQRLFSQAGIELCSLDDIGYTREVVEDSGTFEGNSFLKANQVAKDTGWIAIGDDSGLSIDALGGRPGVDTALYAGGEKVARLQRLNTLLQEMRDKLDRKARLECYLTCVLQDGTVLRHNACIEGEISTKIVNLDGGMTFEPVFVPKGFNVCMSEMDMDTKLSISHRALATQKLIKDLFESHVI